MLDWRFEINSHGIDYSWVSIAKVINFIVRQGLQIRRNFAYPTTKR